MWFSRGSSQRQPIPPYASAFRTQRRGTPYTLEWSIGGFFLLEVTLVCDKDHADHCENAELEFVEHGGHGEGLNDLKKALCKIGAFVVRG